MGQVVKSRLADMANFRKVCHVSKAAFNHLPHCSFSPTTKADIFRICRSAILNLDEAAIYGSKLQRNYEIAQKYLLKTSYHVFAKQGVTVKSRFVVE